MSAPSREDVAQAIRERNGSTQDSDTPTLTAEEVTTIVRKLSFDGVEMDEEEEEVPSQQQVQGDQGQETTTDPNKVQIVIRLRPLEAAINETDPDCFRVLSTTSLLAQPPKTSQSYRSTGTATSFHFSRIFRQETQQTELFEATTRPVLDAAFDGKSGLVFAYGVTNSGKTYMISGTSEAPGVLPQALQYVMDELPKRTEEDKQLVTRITATYLEIYNENVYDLLSPALRRRRALRVQDCDGKIQVRGAVERPIKTLEDGLELLEMGRRHKQMAETNCNSDSSRSHCVFTLHLHHQTSRFSSELRSKVAIVDLAGSERGSKSGATGLRMQEASKINGSLMNLMRCLETLRWNQQHPPSLQKMVPFRESKLARLFQENLVGNNYGPLVMIVAVNPSSHEFDETLRTLKYSAVARELVRTRTSIPRRAAPSATFYDLDGRLKKRRLSTEAPASHAPKPPTDRGVLVAKTTVTSPPQKGKTRHRLSDSTRRQHRSVAPSVAKLRTAEMGTSPMESQREVAERDLHWAKVELENEELREKLAQIQAEKMEMEVRIRAEIGNEMREQLQQIRAHYQSMQRLQPEDLPSARKKRERQHAEESEKLRAHVQELRGKVRECEDEIQRIHKRHRAELDKLQPDLVPVVPVEDES
ncbi:Kinesin-like protein KIF23 [Phytophthora citrophthora]|uniref:Kinesin-like protein n=1 Tax=Phytophthora citrophthora TaxID=4793 RepID=A0AAD9G0M0_9STRA|nr:Kinesin-like protein KIF23 [Phytophthora citrophthora]